MRIFRYLPISALAYRQLYFLQLENYELGRFLALVPRSYAFSSALRQNIVWTPKAILIANLALLLELVLACVITFSAFSSAVPALVSAFLLFHVFLALHFVFLIIVTVCIAPIDALAKRRIIASARAELALHPGMKVVAVVGSYGKTTMKEALAKVLSRKYRTVVTPGNLNTPLGISRTILKELKPDTEVFVVEMGEHYPGDLTFLAALVPPDVVVVTGIGEAHLERFGTIEALTSGIFEAVAGLKPEGLVVLNADSVTIKEQYQKYAHVRDIAFFSAHNDPLSRLRTADLLFREDGSGISFTLSEGSGPVENFSTALLGGYVLGIAEACWIVGKRFGIPGDDIARGFREILPVPHRLERVPSKNGVLVIDDSYNGNPEGARYAIETLGRFKDRRKVYVTPGLVEAGTQAEAVHRAIGKELASVADTVILIRNSVTPFIADELLKNGFEEKDLHWFGTATEAHARLADIVRTGDVVLFQNDWPDNYV